MVGKSPKRLGPKGVNKLCRRARMAVLIATTFEALGGNAESMPALVWGSAFEFTDLLKATYSLWPFQHVIMFKNHDSILFSLIEAEGKCLYSVPNNLKRCLGKTKTSSSLWSKNTGCLCYTCAGMYQHCIQLLVKYIYISKRRPKKISIPIHVWRLQWLQKIS
jgi:hypothetical protein